MLKTLTPILTIQHGLAIASAGCLAACVTVVPAGNYVQVSELPPASDVNHSNYHFRVAPVTATTQETPWRVFLNKSDPRNTVMQTGLLGQTHTVSVLFKHRNIDAARLPQFAEAIYKGGNFQPMPSNPDCVRSDPAHSLQLSPESRGFVAICINRETGDVVELKILEKSDVAHKESPGLFKAMMTFFESFRFK